MNTCKKILSSALRTALAAAVIVALPAIGSAATGTTGNGTLQRDAQVVKNEAHKMGEDVKRVSTNVANDISDSAVTGRVKMALDNYRDITVTTDDGVVKLTGNVDSKQDRDAAVKRARQVNGVKSVKDDLMVNGQKSESVGDYIDDASITTVLKGKYLGQKGLDSLDISVETVNGVVTLSGDVENETQIPMAETLAKDTDGVTGVVNHLKVKR